MRPSAWIRVQTTHEQVVPLQAVPPVKVVEIPDQDEEQTFFVEPQIFDVDEDDLPVAFGGVLNFTIFFGDSVLIFFCV